MRHYTMPGREALRRIRPGNCASRIQLRWILAFVFIGVAGAGGFIYTKYRIQLYREQNWDSAIATVEDVRPKLVGQVNSAYGGKMLYKLDVLARFPGEEGTQERWISVDRLPIGLDAVHLDKQMWVGKNYLVRWQPSHPDRIQIEIPEIP